MFRRGVRVKPVMVGLGLAVVAALFVGSGAAQAQGPTKVRIGSSVRSIFSLPIYVADQKGYLKELGLDPEVTFFAGGPPATAALLGGSVDVISASFENQLKVVKRGQFVTSIMTMQADFSGALVVRKEVTERLKRKPTVADMKGLRIGTLSRGGYADMAARYLLQVGPGLDPDRDTTLIPIKGFDKVLAAGDAGHVDAALMVEPWQTVAVEGLKKWDYVLHMTIGEGPDVFHDMGYVTLQTSRDYLQKNRATAEKIVRALVRAQNFIADTRNLDETVQIALRVFPNSDAEALRTSIQKQLKTFRPAVTPAMLEKNMDLLLKNGAIELPAPRFEDVVDVSFEKLWKEYGRN